MTVRAKFRVTQVAHFENDSTTISLAAVTSGSEENKAFFKWTPSATITLQTVNKDAAEQFKPGAEFYCDFTAAS